jgi:hypothetical protein
LSIRELTKVDAELRQESIKLENNFQERMIKEQQESESQLIVNLTSQKQTLFNFIKSKQEEIKSIERNLKDSRDLLVNTNSNVTGIKLGDTSEEKYKRFITGEEKQIIESRIEKSLKARRKEILAHSDESRLIELQEECGMLEEKAKNNEYMMREKEKELENYNNNVEKLNKEINDKKKMVI